MAPPERTPMLLFPCGHSFCRRCLETQRRKGGRNAACCPLCRVKAESIAENIPLRQLIERFVGERDALSRGEVKRSDDVLRPAAAPPDADAKREAAAAEGEPAPRARGGPREARRYAAEFKSCAMRRQILQHELDELADARAEAARRRDAAALAGERLEDERDATRRRLDELRAELALVERHVAEQQRKRDEHRATADELDRKIAMVGETIAGLSASMDRAQVLAESIDPHIDLREDGGAR